MRSSRLPSYFEHHFIIMAIFLVFVIARYMQWGERKEIFKTIRIEFLLGTILVIACTILLASRPIDFKPAKRVLIAIILLFVVMGTQIPFAANKPLAQTIFIDRVVKFAFLTYFLIVLVQSPRYMRFFIASFLFSIFYITQESFRGLLSGGLYWENQGIMRLHGAVPIYAHPNSLSGVAMGAVPFVIFLFPVVQRLMYKAFLLALLTTSLVCVIYSGSRTAYLGFISFLGWWWFLSRYKGRALLIGLVIGLITINFLPDQYIERFKSITGQEAEGHSREGRLEVMEQAFQIFLENPAGIGLGSFPAVRRVKFGKAQDTHNLYLEVATNMGIHGFVVFIYLVATLLQLYRASFIRFQQQHARLQAACRGKKLSSEIRIKLAQHDYDLRFLVALCKACGGFIMIRLILGIFGMDLYEIYWWFGAGMAICLACLEVSARRNTIQLAALCAEPE